MAATAPRARLPFRLITHNVRFATATPSPGEELWPVRLPRLCAQLTFLTAGRDSAFICLQEVLAAQLQDISRGLGEEAWAHVGVGRDDGRSKGEHSPIFYRRTAWRCEHSRTYWLSETPDVPSKGWDADLPRVVTVGRFRHETTGTRVVVMNTHLDHRGENARVESARLLLRLAAEWAGHGDSNDDHVTPDRDQHGEEAATTGLPFATSTPFPVFLAGDFNSTPDGGAYKTITHASSSGQPGAMMDISGLVPDKRKYGNGEITYTSFGEPYETPSRIDFLFTWTLSSLPTSSPIVFSSFGILPNSFDDGVLMSDHRAVVGDMEI